MALYEHKVSYSGSAGIVQPYMFRGSDVEGQADTCPDMSQSRHVTQDSMTPVILHAFQKLDIG
jgi:hypothetical protein